MDVMQPCYEKFPIENIHLQRGWNEKDAISLRRHCPVGDKR